MQRGDLYRHYSIAEHSLLVKLLFSFHWNMNFVFYSSMFHVFATTVQKPWPFLFFSFGRWDVHSTVGKSDGKCSALP